MLDKITTEQAGNMTAHQRELLRNDSIDEIIPLSHYLLLNPDDLQGLFDNLKLAEQNRVAVFAEPALYYDDVLKRAENELNAIKANIETIATIIAQRAKGQRMAIPRDTRRAPLEMNAIIQLALLNKLLGEEVVCIKEVIQDYNLLFPASKASCPCDECSNSSKE